MIAHATQHNNIILPRGFYAMLCHKAGAPAAEWDRSARLVEEAENMRRVLVKLTSNAYVDQIRKVSAGIVAEADEVLARIG